MFAFGLCKEFLLQAPVKVHIFIQASKLEKVFESFSFISKEINWMLGNQIFRMLCAYQPPRNFIFISFQNQNTKSRLRLKIQVYTCICLYIYVCVYMCGGGGLCVHSHTNLPMYIYLYICGAC